MVSSEWCGAKNDAGPRPACPGRRTWRLFVFHNAEQLRWQCLKRNNFYRLSFRCSIPFSKHVEVVIVALEPERATVVMQSATSSCQEAEFNHISAIISPENCELGVHLQQEHTNWQTSQKTRTGDSSSLTQTSVMSSTITTSTCFEKGIEPWKLSL